MEEKPQYPNNIIIRNFQQPDTIRYFENGHLSILNFGSYEVGLITLQPGWKWAKSVKPLVCTELCEQDHLGYILSGIHALQQVVITHYRGACS